MEAGRLRCQPCKRQFTTAEVLERSTLPHAGYVPERIYLRVRCRQCGKLYEFFIRRPEWREDLLDDRDEPPGGIIG